MSTATARYAPPFHTEITSFGFARRKYGRELSIDACRMEDLPGFGTYDRAHRLDFHEVLFVQRGRGTVRQDEVEARLRSPCIIVTAPGQIRRFKLMQRLQGPVILWAPDAVDRLTSHPAFNTIVAGPFIHLSAGDMTGASSVAETMIAEIVAPRSDLPRMLEALLSQLLLLLDRGPGGANAAPFPPSLLERLKQLVETRFRHNHRVSFYAETLGVSPDHLAAVVRQHGGAARGTGAVRALIQQRIQLEAKRLLLHTDMDVAQIAYSLGYQDPSHFTRAFRRETGLPPSQFRTRTSEMYQ